MAEIRSTLDIIMEKAKNLKVTEEDKKEFAEKEVQGRTQGLFQKYLDGILLTEQLKREMASFDKDLKPVAERELLGACLSTLTVEGDNQSLFEMLDQLLGCDIKPILDLIDEFQDQQDAERSKKSASRIQALRKWGVSGSAVIPNLTADTAWRDFLLEMQERFQERLKGLRYKVSGGRAFNWD